MITKSRILATLGISSERMKLAKMKFVRLNGTWFLIRPVMPVDFMGHETHPMNPWAEARDRIGHEERQKMLEKTDWSNREQVIEFMGKIKKVYVPVFLRGVIWPVLSQEDARDKVSVEDLFADMGLASALYRAIADITLEKKTIMGMSWPTRLWSWMLLRSATARIHTRSPITTTPASPSTAPSTAAP